jgi:cytidylate kinase
LSSIIAIDGPSASGKSSVSKMVAKKLGFTHVDSGAFYRTTTLEALLKNVDLTNESAICEMMDNLQLEFIKKDVSILILIEGKDKSNEIRSMTVNNKVSIVAAMPEVRKRIVVLLQSMTRFGSLVMEGRDIGTVVFPDTPFKYYLEASPEERAKRRSLELNIADNSAQNLVKKNIENRDKLDSTRSVAPLKIADNALIIDTTGRTIQEVAEYIISDYHNKITDE